MCRYHVANCGAYTQRQRSMPGNSDGTTGEGVDLPMPETENTVPDSDGQQTGTPPAPPAAPDAPTLTQADLDRIVKDRLTRERAKYADYDKFKEAAARLQAVEDADKTAQQKAAEEVARAKAEAEQAKADVIRFRAAAAHGIGGDDIDLIGTGPEEQVTARAQRIGQLLVAERELAELKKQQDGKQPQQGRPVPREWQPGATPSDVNGGPSAKERAAAMARTVWGAGAVGQSK